MSERKNKSRKTAGAGTDTEGRERDPGKRLCNAAGFLPSRYFPGSRWKLIKRKPGGSRQPARPAELQLSALRQDARKGLHTLCAALPRIAYTPFSQHGLWRKDCSHVRSKQLSSKRRATGLTSPSFSWSPSFYPCPYFFSVCVGSDFGPVYAMNTHRPDGSPQTALSPLKPTVFLCSWGRKNGHQLVSTTGLHNRPASSPTFYSRDQINMHHLALH